PGTRRAGAPRRRWRREGPRGTVRDGRGRRGEQPGPPDGDPQHDELERVRHGRVQLRGRVAQVRPEVGGHLQDDERPGGGGDGGPPAGTGGGRRRQ
ncbi:hypothetical protein THAOC_12153, partial [Thalassiosira oceanica]